MRTSPIRRTSGRCEPADPVFWQMPTWLLLPFAFAANEQSAPPLDRCKKIVAIARLNWVPGTKDTKKDDVAWFEFHIDHRGGPLLCPCNAVPSKLARACG